MKYLRSIKAFGLSVLFWVQPIPGKSLPDSTAQGAELPVTAQAGKVSPDEGQHEFYVGLTDIVYNLGTRTFEITLKVFTDDLELALVESGGGEKIILADYGAEAGNDSLIFAYVAEHFTIFRKGAQPLAMHPVGRETELDVTWIYLETDPTQPLKEAVVSNTMMMEIYEDQTHIVHLRQGEKTKSTLLHRGKLTGTLKS